MPSHSADPNGTRPGALGTPRPASAHWTGWLAQSAGVLTVIWAVGLLLLGWLAPDWEGPTSSGIGFAWKATINAIWVGFGVAVVLRQRFSTFLLFYVHGASAALLASFSLVPGRWSFGMQWSEWALYVAIPFLCALLLAPDVVRRWRKPLRDDELP